MHPVFVRPAVSLRQSLQAPCMRGLCLGHPLPVVSDALCFQHLLCGPHTTALPVPYSSDCCEPGNALQPSPKCWSVGTGSLRPAPPVPGHTFMACPVPTGPRFALMASCCSGESKGFSGKSLLGSNAWEQAGCDRVTGGNQVNCDQLLFE